MTISIATACRRAWKSGQVEKIAGVADGLRLNHGFDFAQIHASFCESTGKEISLAKFDEIMRLADDGYTGTLAELSRRTF
jgi:hypothetical protein